MPLHEWASWESRHDAGYLHPKYLHPYQSGVHGRLSPNLYHSADHDVPLMGDQNSFVHKRESLWCGQGILDADNRWQSARAHVAPREYARAPPFLLDSRKVVQKDDQKSCVHRRIHPIGREARDVDNQ